MAETGRDERGFDEMGLDEMGPGGTGVADTGVVETGVPLGWIGVGAGPVSLWIGRAGGTSGVRVWAPAAEQTSITDAETIRARRIDKDSTTFSVRPLEARRLRPAGSRPYCPANHLLQP
ncbi:MAG TPA: hypothetical protein VHZ26_09550 [Caulobacteraceae bacterium]|nr:hypothetical protein [Caulobacteraceae bacterium]